MSTELVRQDINILTQYVGKGYGIPSPECIEAIKLVARTEAILFDPIYTGKAMAGLIDQIRKGKITKNETVVFLHTGGLPSLFMYCDEMIGTINENQ